MSDLVLIWRNRWVKAIFALVVLFLIFWFLHAIKTIAIYFVVSFIAAYICDPLVDWMEAKRIPRTIGVTILSILIVGGLALFWLIAIPMFQSEIASLSSDLPRYIEQTVGKLIPWFEQTFRIEIPKTYTDWSNQFAAHEDTIRQYAQKLSEPIWNMLSGTFSSLYAMIMSLFGVIVIPVAWFYLLRDIDPLKARLFEFIPPRHQKSVGGFFKEVNEVVSNFLQGQVIVCLALSALYIIGLQFIVGVPLGFLIGLFAGFASIVPYLGLILGIAPALILAFLEYGDWLHPLGVVLVFTGAQVLEGTVITPKIVGDKLGMHPVTIIFAILIWGELLGFVGILIAVPATAVFLVALRRVISLYFKSDFFNDKKQTADH